MGSHWVWDEQGAFLLDLSFLFLLFLALVILEAWWLIVCVLVSARPFEGTTLFSASFSTLAGGASVMTLLT